MTVDAAGRVDRKVDVLRDLEHEMGVTARRIRRVIGERARAVDPDLAPAGFLLLSLLADSVPRRGAEIVECLGMDKGAISRQVQHLAELGLVVRQPDPVDGRAHLLSATPEALRRLESVAAQRRASLEERLDDWSARELREFVARLARYNQALA